MSLPAGKRAAVIEARLARLGLLEWARRYVAPYNVTLADVLGRRRTATVSKARQRLLAVIRWTLGLSYPEIGILFDLDHSTVIAAVRNVERDLAAEHGVPA